MAKAERLWQDAGNRQWVKFRIGREVAKFTQGAAYEHFEEVESQVWLNVAARIESYVDNGTPKGWLTSVVFSTVQDWFAHQHAGKRDVRREVQDLAAIDNYDPEPYARPKRPEGSCPDMDSDLKTAALAAGMERATKNNS